MGWDKQYRYKMLGKPAVYNNEMLFLFKLTDFELFVGGGKRGHIFPAIGEITLEYQQNSMMIPIKLT